MTHASPTPPVLVPKNQTHPNWPVQLAADWRVQLPAHRLAMPIAKPYIFGTQKYGGVCRYWFKIDTDGTMTIAKGYACDGCTGVKDYDEALPGCIVHDALRQAVFLDREGIQQACGIDRRVSDLIFRDVMAAYGFCKKCRWIYYLGVRPPLGALFSLLANASLLIKSLWTGRPPDEGCSSHRHPPTQSRLNT